LIFHGLDLRSEACREEDPLRCLCHPSAHRSLA
jgi:hypothetical protein